MKSIANGSPLAALAEDLRAAVRHAEPRLREITDAAAGAKPQARDGWSKKQELGHLIDSAVNNRLRFVTAALHGKFTGHTYDGPGWVELGGWAETEWRDLVELWARSNRALARLVERIPPEQREAQCRIGGSFRGSLEALIEDYIGHMEHHLDHILG
jgi:hypothetical protein